MRVPSADVEEEVEAEGEEGEEEGKGMGEEEEEAPLCSVRWARPRNARSTTQRARRCVMGGLQE